MNHQRSLLLAFIFFIQADLSALGQISCIDNGGNYTSNSTYSVNLNITLASLSTNVDDNIFYNASTGENPDRANAIALCRGHVQPNKCRECVQNAAAELVRSCPNRKQAVSWFDLCMLRYSNETIYGIRATSPRYWLWNTGNASSPEQFKADLRTLLDKLRNKAASGGSMRKVAAANVSGPDFRTIFALVQCTPDLSTEDCTSCLIEVAGDIPRCCNSKRGARIPTPSCDLRFETYPFFNETRLRELDSTPFPEPAPVPAPVPFIEPPLHSSPGNHGKVDGNETRTVIIVVVSIVVCLILAVFAIILLRKRKKQKSVEDPEYEVCAVESLQYSFSTIKAATNDFSENNKLGQGGFGTVYKGKFSNGQEIVVKRLSRSSEQSDLEFKNEVLLLAKLQHKNLVRLLGFTLEGMEKLLVYEFVQNASLDLFLFDPINHSYLDWDRRYKIIVGVAQGILYLHKDSPLRIIHRDLKANNILLDGEMNPKIADFGLARLSGQDETQGNTSRVVGTYGYRPPEYLIHGQFSIKSDVFSFGVLILEIISGRKNSSFQSESAENLLSFAWRSWREGAAANVVDPFLRCASSSINKMLRCIHIGLLCVQENAVDRPTIASVILMLSSFSMTLAVPSEPAFYFPSGYGPDVSRVQKYNSRDPECDNLSRQDDQSDHSSQNNASISELRPQ